MQKFNSAIYLLAFVPGASEDSDAEQSTGLVQNAGADQACDALSSGVQPVSDFRDLFKYIFP